MYTKNTEINKKNCKQKKKFLMHKWNEIKLDWKVEIWTGTRFDSVTATAICCNLYRTTEYYKHIKVKSSFSVL